MHSAYHICSPLHEYFIPVSPLRGVTNRQITPWGMKPSAIWRRSACFCKSIITCNQGNVFQQCHFMHATIAPLSSSNRAPISFSTKEGNLMINHCLPACAFSVMVSCFKQLKDG